MQSLPPPLLPDACHNRCQVRRVADRPRFHDGPGDPSGIVLFRFLVEQVGHFLLRPPIHNLVCRLLLEKKKLERMMTLMVAFWCTSKWSEIRATDTPTRERLMLHEWTMASMRLRADSV